MKYTYLGRTGLKVSRLVLGTMNFGPQTDEAEAFAIMDAALEAGIQFFDTANVYGGWEPEGHRGWTEEIMGRWFAQGGGRRERVVLATKVYADFNKDPHDPNDNAGGLSAYKIKKSIEGSLRRLQTDHIELYQMHHIDAHAPWDEIFGAFEDLVAAGKVVYVGSSNFGGRHLAYAQAAAKERHFLGLVSEQHKYSLLIRQPELEVLPAALELGLGVIPWSPLAGGLLGGHALDGQGGDRSRAAAAALDDAARAQLEAFHQLAAGLGEAPANVALAWTLAHPAVTGPIIGPRTVAQLNETLRAVEIELSPETLAQLDAIFPGPGGPAPQAYAW
ncbi:MAG: aldo/keto reductase [Bifidobacteriaceae bacterium]|jgi:aryl-alcohol dehydrogenase-like predicted oxidoreductase|nr:aldo/keto reductase [Bifidobacteriaceae bacterium]